MERAAFVQSVGQELKFGVCPSIGRLYFVNFTSSASASACVESSLEKRCTASPPSFRLTLCSTCYDLCLNLGVLIAAFSIGE